MNLRRLYFVAQGNKCDSHNGNQGLSLRVSFENFNHALKIILERKCEDLVQYILWSFFFFRKWLATLSKEFFIIDVWQGPRIDIVYFKHTFTLWRILYIGNFSRNWAFTCWMEIFEKTSNWLYLLVGNIKTLKTW